MATATAAPATRAGGRRLSQRRVEAILGLVFALPYVIHFLVLDVGAIIFAFGLSFFETDLLTGFNFMCQPPVNEPLVPVLRRSRLRAVCSRMAW